MKDKQGREYAKLDDLKVGDKVKVDGDFVCMTAWSEKEVKEDKFGKFVECDGDENGNIAHHYLEAQEKEGYLIGIYRV